MSTCYTWGWGKYGQLGHGNELNESTPVPIDLSTLKGGEMTEMSLGMCYCLSISSKDEVYSWGYGKNNQLGQSDDRNQVVPKRIQVLRQLKILQVAAGYEFSVALSANGEVYTWGCGCYGYLGKGDEVDHMTPAPLTCFGHDKDKGQVTQISCGLHHTVVLNSNGQLFSWGYGANGRLGTGKYDNELSPSLVKKLSAEFGFKEKIVYIQSGWHFSIALTDRGKLFSWGYGKDWSLGLESQSDSNIPQPIEKYLQLKRFNSTNLESENIKITKYSCGGKHTIAISESGDVYSWGRGEFGRLGHGDEQHVKVPQLIEFFTNKNILEVACGGYHSLARNAKAVYSFGCGDFGRLGLNDCEHRLLPTKIPSFKRHEVTRIFAGSYMSAAFVLDSQLERPTPQRKCNII